MRIGGVIVAGGASRRMGTDKLTLTLNGKRLIDHVIERLRPQVDDLVINANGNAERFTGVDVIPDVRATGSPLAGLHTALAWGRAKHCTHVLTASGDTPFLPADLVARLAAHDAAIAESLGQRHYLIGLWPIRSLPLLTDGLFRVQDWAATVNAVPVHWDDDPFFNINTPEDLATAARKPAI